MQKGIGSLIIAVAFISYGIYCLIKGGTHHKDAGWVSKEERPKSFMFAMALYFSIGILSIFYYIFLNFIR